MIEKILDLSVRHRWFIVLLTAVACALGVWSLNKLPIDAVPDVTNNQVQINAVAPALTPVEMEKQITFQIENLINLDQIPSKVKVIALPAKWRTESAPARVIALLDE